MSDLRCGTVVIDAHGQARCVPRLLQFGDKRTRRERRPVTWRSNWPAATDESANPSDCKSMRKIHQRTHFAFETAVSARLRSPQICGRSPAICPAGIVRVGDGMPCRRSVVAAAQASDFPGAATTLPWRRVPVERCEQKFNKGASHCCSSAAEPIRLNIEAAVCNLIPDRLWLLTKKGRQFVN